MACNIDLWYGIILTTELEISRFEPHRYEDILLVGLTVIQLEEIGGMSN